MNMVGIIIVAAAIIVLEIIQIGMEIRTREKLRDQIDRNRCCEKKIREIEACLDERVRGEHIENDSRIYVDDEEAEISFEELERFMGENR